jgi:hypothetical protein
MLSKKEIEWKILEIDVDSVISSIKAIWWVLETKDKFLETVRMINAEKLKIRIRDYWDYINAETKTFKEKNWTIKMWYENICSTHKTLQEWISFYENKWFKILRRDKKNRTTYILDLKEKWWLVKFEIDIYSDLDWLVIPPLLEIEGGDENIINDIVKSLWFKTYDLKDWWTKKLLDYYKNKS